MLNIPYFQRKMTVIITRELKAFLGTELSIDRIDIGLMNRIIIDGLDLKDLQGNDLLKVPRLSASFEILPILQGKISIRSAQLYGADVKLNKHTEQDPMNCQFLIQAFSNPGNPDKSPLDLRINSLLIRQGSISYDLLSAPPNDRKPDLSHLRIHDLLATVSLKYLSADSLNFALKRMSFREQSGLELNRLKFHLLANREQANLRDFEIRLPRTTYKLSEVHANYKGVKENKHWADSLFFSFEVLPSTLLLSDLAPFLPVLSTLDTPLHTEMHIDGSPNNLYIRQIHFYSSTPSQKAVELRGDVHFRDLLRSEDSFVEATLPHFSIAPEEIQLITQNLAPHGVKVLAVLSQIGKLSLRADLQGYFTDLMADCTVFSESGDLHASMHYQKWNGQYKLSSTVTGDHLNLGRLLQEDQLGTASFEAKAEAFLNQGKFTSLQAKGDLKTLQYKNYTYESIVFDGHYDHRGVDGMIRVRDPNGNIDINGRFDLDQKIREYHLTAKIEGFNPHNLNLTPQYEDSRFAFLLNLDFAGNNLRDILGSIQVDSLDIQLPEKHYLITHMDLNAYQDQDLRKIIFNAPFAEADIQGKFDYTTLKYSLFNMLSQYTPSLLSQNGKVVPDNDFRFSVWLRDTGVLTDLFQLPFTVHEHSTLQGFIKDESHTMRLEGSFPDWSYGNARIRNTELFCTNTPDYFDCNVSGRARMKDGSFLNMNLLAKAQDDGVQASFEWDNKAGVECRGKLSASAALRKSLYSTHLVADIALLPTEVVLQDSLWQVERALIRIDSSRIDISGFGLKHGPESLTLNGSFSKEEQEHLVADLKNVQLGYIFDIINFHPVEFEGAATGKITASQLLHNPQVEAALEVKDFLFNGAPLGDLAITGGFDADQDAVTLRAQMHEPHLSSTRVTGEVHPKQKGLDLRIHAEGTNVSFLQPYVDGILTNVQGRAHGDFRLSGGFKTLAIEGKGKADATFYVDILGVTYQLHDTVKCEPGRFILEKAFIQDAEGHRGTVDGILRHAHFGDFTYQLQIQAEEMLILHKRETFDLPFYGKVYASGNATLTGDTRQLDVSAGLRTSGQTEFSYKMISANMASNSSFVQFVSAGEYAEHSLEGNPERFPAVPENEEMDVRLNLLIDVTPQATMRVIVDPRAGDYISCTGSGNIRMDFFNKGDLNIFGTYTVNQGMYKFSLQEVIRKDFLIRSGSFVSFNGDPYRANCNLNTAYTVNAVSLRDLGNDVISVLPNATTSVRVNCLLDITGMISSPEIHLGLELPNENEEVQRVIRNFISTDDQMNMQILYLLGIGKFYTPDYANKTGQNSDAMSAVLSSTLSGQLNNMLSQVINSDKWNFGVNGSTGEDGWTDMEFQGMLSGQLLNNRLLINGNFGYRDNSMINSNQQSNFIGDFDIEYLLTKTGDVRLKAYNKANDRYSTKTTLNTQGIGVMYRKDFNSWWDFLPWRNRKKNKS